MFILYKQKRPSFSYEFGTNNLAATARLLREFLTGVWLGELRQTWLWTTQRCTWLYFTLLLTSLEGSIDSLPPFLPPPAGIKTYQVQLYHPQISPWTGGDWQGSARRERETYRLDGHWLTQNHWPIFRPFLWKIFSSGTVSCWPSFLPFPSPVRIKTVIMESVAPPVFKCNILLKHN